MRKRTKLTLLSNKWFVAFLVVLFTFIIDLFVAYRWLGLEVFYSNPSYEDSDLRSFYEKISYNSSILELNKEIVIIQTDSIDREGIAELLCKMEEYNPAVIGVDLIFGQSSNAFSHPLISTPAFSNKLTILGKNSFAISLCINKLSQALHTDGF